MTDIIQILTFCIIEPTITDDYKSLIGRKYKNRNEFIHALNIALDDIEFIEDLPMSTQELRVCYNEVIEVYDSIIMD